MALAVGLCLLTFVLQLYVVMARTVLQQDVESMSTTNRDLHSSITADYKGLSFSSPISNTHNLRRLQVINGTIDRTCEQLLDSTLEGIFAKKDCICSPVGFPPALVIDCERVQESCIISRPFTDAPDDKLLCGSPGIRITINVWSIIFGGLPVVAELCFYDTSVFNVTLPDIVNPVCFGIFAGLPGSVPLANLLGLIFGRVAPTAKLLGDTTSKSTSVLKNQRPLSINKKSCVPKIGDGKQNCKSCTICSPDAGGGIVFDCTNIVPDFHATECTIFPSFN